MDNNMRYASITSPDVNNGEGCRVTLWIQGCSHHCQGCHNTHTWDYCGGDFFDEESYQNLLMELNKQHIQGLTISGGDPLDQSDETLDEIYELLLRLSVDAPGKDIWLYTGYYIDDLKPKQIDIVDMCDVVVDGPYIQSKRDLTLPFRGSSNQTIWKILHEDIENYCEKFDV